MKDALDAALGKLHVFVFELGAKCDDLAQQLEAKKQQRDVSTVFLASLWRDLEAARAATSSDRARKASECQVERNTLARARWEVQVRLVHCALARGRVCMRVTARKTGAPVWAVRCVGVGCGCRTDREGGRL